MRSILLCGHKTHIVRTEKIYIYIFKLSEFVE